MMHDIKVPYCRSRTKESHSDLISSSTLFSRSAERFLSHNSLLSTAEDGEVIEVSMVGNEGTTALPLIMHAREMPYRAQI